MIDLSEPVEITWVGNKITFKGSRVTIVLEVEPREMRTVYNGRRGKGHIKVKIDEDGPPIQVL